MKTTQSYDYWKKRQDERLAYSERVSNQTVANIGDVYDDSLKRVENRIENILDNYSKSIKMPKDKLKELLSEHDKQTLLRELQEDLIKNGANTNENLEWLRGNYLKRLTDQESIKLQLENERRIISTNEKAISSLGYGKTIEQTYMSLTKDLTGTSKSLNESAKNSMLSKRWVAGKNYSERVWTNTGELSKELDKVINSALISGSSKNEIVNELMKRYDVARYRAEALVRTEMNYFENQTELKSYKDLGVTHYMFIATRDSRTSEVCSSIDNQRFAVKDAKAGENYPPMHPNCRSGTVPDLEFEEDYRVYKNPITRKREKTTKPYDEWLKEIEDNAETKYNKDRDKILDTFNSSSFKSVNFMNLDNLKEVLTPDEAILIRSYSDTLYKPVNEYFRTGAGSDETKVEARAINKAINKTELKEDVLLRRGVAGLTLRQMGIDGLGETTLKGLISTTFNPETSKMFMKMKQKRKVYMEIIAPKGTKGMYIEDLSKYRNEKEFLLPHKTKIMVESIKEKEEYTHVKARIIK